MEKEHHEIQAMADKVSDAIDAGSNKYPGMTYEEGVRAALEWVLNEDDNEDPI